MMALIERRRRGWGGLMVRGGPLTSCSSLPTHLPPSLLPPACLPAWLAGWLATYCTLRSSTFIASLFFLFSRPIFPLLFASSHLLSSHYCPASPPSLYLSSSSPLLRLLGGVFPFNTSWHLQMLRACVLFSSQSNAHRLAAIGSVAIAAAIGDRRPSERRKRAVHLH